MKGAFCWAVFMYAGLWLTYKVSMSAEYYADQVVIYILGGLVTLVLSTLTARFVQKWS